MVTTQPDQDLICKMCCARAGPALLKNILKGIEETGTKTIVSKKKKLSQEPELHR
jgi:hypothetical protein